MLPMGEALIPSSATCLRLCRGGSGSRPRGTKRLVAVEKAVFLQAKNASYSNFLIFFEENANKMSIALCGSDF